MTQQIAKSAAPTAAEVEGASEYRRLLGPTDIDNARGRALFEELMAKDYRKKVEYVPFLASDDQKITLTPQLVMRFLCKPTKSGELCTEDQATKFIMLCKARKLNPWEGDAYLVGYDTTVNGKNVPEFNLVTSIYAFLKRAEVHGQFDGMKSGVVVKNKETDEILDIGGDYVYEDCVLVGGWAEVHFKNRSVPTYRRLDVRTFDKGYSQWNSNKAGMIVKCAEADALRSSFPNTFGGMYLDGEMPTSDPAVPPVNARLENARAAQNTPGVAASVPPPPPAPNPTPQEAGAAPRNSAPSQNSPPPPAAGGAPRAAAAAGGRRKAQVQTCTVCGATMAKGVCPNCGPTSGGAEASPSQQPAPPPPHRHPPTPPAPAAPNGEGVAAIQAQKSAEGPPPVVDQFAHWRTMSAADVKVSWEAMTEAASALAWRQMPADVQAIVRQKLAE